MLHTKMFLHFSFLCYNKISFFRKTGRKIKLKNKNMKVAKHFWWLAFLAVMFLGG